MVELHLAQQGFKYCIHFVIKNDNVACIVRYWTFDLSGVNQFETLMQSMPYL